MASSDPATGPIEPSIHNQPFSRMPGNWPQVSWTQVEFFYDHDRAVALRSICIIVASLLSWASYSNGTPILVVIVIVWPAIFLLLMVFIYGPVVINEPIHKGAIASPKPSKREVRCVLWVDPLDEQQLNLIHSRETKNWFGKSQFSYVALPLADLETFEKTTLNAYLKQPSDEIRFIENYLILAHVHGRDPVFIAKDGGGAYRVDHLFQVLSTTFQAQRSALLRQHRLGHRKQRNDATTDSGVPDSL